MASIGHVMLGLAAARFARKGQSHALPPVASGVLWASLAMLPDADVIGFPLGIAYAAPWGHRGASHSVAFACGIAAISWVIMRARQLPGLRTALIALAVVSSHGLLDSLTDGGLGVALLWPFSNERFFAPWTPLPVAPIGANFFTTMRGARVALVELLAFAPFVVYALWPARRTVTASARD
jgi:inner membrane protein